jgi:hypothetical protein
MSIYLPDLWKFRSMIETRSLEIPSGVSNQCHYKTGIHDYSNPTALLEAWPRTGGPMRGAVLESVLRSISGVFTSTHYELLACII